MVERTLTKLILNNKIVEMRKYIRQARIHCIGKLCREMKKMKCKKGTDEQVAKNLRKVDKLAEQMSIIKKVNSDDVSKFALLNEKSVSEISNDVNESIENKAFSRLACHKSVQQRVLEFRELFPDWKKSLVTLLESLGEKYRNQKQNKKVNFKKKVKNSNLKSKDASFTSNVKESKLKTSDFSHIGTVKSSSGSWTVINLVSEDFNDESHLSVNDSKNFFNSKELSVKNVTLSKPKTVENNAEDQSSKSNHKKFKIREKKVNEIESKPLQILTKKITVPTPNSATVRREGMKTEPDLNKISDVNIPEIAADPFFVTKDNKEYLSISAKQIYTGKDEIIGPEKHLSRPDRYHAKKKPFNIKSNNNNTGRYQKSDNAKNVPISPSIHPSWEAKKKLTTIIQNSQFQGKKIKFND